MRVGLQLLDQCYRPAALGLAPPLDALGGPARWGTNRCGTAPFVSRIPGQSWLGVPSPVERLAAVTNTAQIWAESEVMEEED
jgi:hypothetical protein